jgi:hypothetical protein
MTSDGSPDSPDAGEQVAVAPEETAMHVEGSVADEAADELAADTDLGSAEADIRTEANQEIEETEEPETEKVEES